MSSAPVTETASAPRRGTLLRGSAMRLVSDGSGLVLGISSIVTARVLGPSGKGTLAALGVRDGLREPVRNAGTGRRRRGARRTDKGEHPAGAVLQRGRARVVPPTSLVALQHSRRAMSDSSRDIVQRGDVEYADDPQAPDESFPVQVSPPNGGTVVIVVSG